MTPTPTTDSAVSPVREPLLIDGDFARIGIEIADAISGNPSVDIMSEREKNVLRGDIQIEAIRILLAARRPIDTNMEPAGWQWRMRTRQVPAAPWGEWCEWRDGKANVSERVSSHAQYEERPVFASRTPNTETVVKAEPVAWMTEATDGLPLNKRGTTADPEVAAYWAHTSKVIPLYASPPSPAEVTEDRIVANAMRLCAKAEQAYGFMDMSSNEAKENWTNFCKAKVELLELTTAALQLNKKG